MIAPACNLLPKPQHLRFHSGRNAASRPRAVIADVGRREPEAYRLSISERQILIEAPRESGLFYGRQTLGQLRQQFPDGVPCLEILDWPDFPARGFYHDVTRGKVPKLKTLLALAEKCAHYKINQLQLYIEHTFAFRRHPEVWQGADPLTADEIRALDAHCARFHIDLIPSFSTFGHFYSWIHTKKFQHLNELERDVSGEAFTWWDRMKHYTLDCRNPESLALVREIVTEVRPLFRSKFFNICADETFDLGRGRNKAFAEKHGKGRLYVDFLKQIMEVVREVGATPMFWGDVIGHHPELIREIPPDAVALDWDYSAGLTYSQAELMEKSGLPFYICPGVSGWDRWVNDFRTAHRNITRFAREGKKRGASGLLNTDWGDFGHINALGLSLPGLILGASVAWNTRTGAWGERRIEEAISRYEFGDPSGRLLGLLRQASMSSRAGWQMIAFSQQPRPADIDSHPVAGEVPTGFARDRQSHSHALGKLLLLTPKIEKILLKASPRDRLSVDEIRTGLLGLRVMEEVTLLLHARPEDSMHPSPNAKDVVARILRLDVRLRREWLRRNKPSEYARIGEVLRGVAQQVSLQRAPISPRGNFNSLHHE